MRFPITRRRLLHNLGALGIGSAVLQRALAAQVEEAGTVTPEMIQQAEWIACLKLSEEDRKTLAKALQATLRDFAVLRKIKLENGVPPAVQFHPACGAGGQFAGASGRLENSVTLTETAAPKRPDTPEGLAFLPVSELAPLLRTRQVSSVELTRLYLSRLRQYDPTLLCVVTLTEDVALKQAEQADREIAAGRYRGPLHGVPWGAKDLIAYPGYPTSWGATPFKGQSFDAKATVARRLEEALPKMLSVLPESERPLVRARFYRVASHPNGVYALVDYVNFKGEGIAPSERYSGVGWGLLQVLEPEGQHVGRGAQGGEGDGAALRQGPRQRHGERR